MKYPEEAVIAYLDEVSYGQVRELAEYCKWAHEQLRPRKVSEEPIPPGRAVLIWAQIQAGEYGWTCWYEAESSDTDGSYWLPMPPPPPKPDKFDEWWENGGSLKHCGTGTTWKEDFKGAWDACKKAYNIKDDE